MDVIGFLCVSLGSSTVQLHASLGSRRAYICSEAGFSSQNGDLAWGVYYRRAAICCAFLWAKGLNAKYIDRNMFSVYVGKCLSRKAVHNWVEKFSQGRSKVADDARPGAGVAEATVKRLLCCGFRRTGKAMRQVYQCLWRICRISHGLRFIYQFVTYLLTLLRSYWRTSDQCLFKCTVCVVCVLIILWRGCVECGTLCKGSVLPLTYFCMLLVGDGLNVGFGALFEKMQDSISVRKKAGNTYITKHYIMKHIPLEFSSNVVLIDCFFCFRWVSADSRCVQ
jgi:hypothetical protein